MEKKIAVCFFIVEFLFLDRVAPEPMVLLVLRVLLYVAFSLILIFKACRYCKAKALTIT